MPDQSRSNRLVIGLLLVAAFVVILNETILGVAIPRLMTSLDITARTAQWLSTGFLLTMAVVIPISGFLIDRLSTRTVFTLAMATFSAGTALAAAAPGFPVLLVGRVVQATGTAVMMPLLMTTVLHLVPVQRRGQVMGLISVVISVAPAMGPTISGFILQIASWRWLFIAVLPIAIGALILGRLKLVNVTEPKKKKLDVPSIFLSAAGFGGLVFGFSSIGSPLPVGALVGVFAASIAVLAIFVWRQLRLLRTGSPLLDLRPFTFHDFRTGIGVMMVGFGTLLGVALVWPIYLQNVRGASSVTTGLLLLPGGLAMGLLGPVIGRIYDRYGARWLATGGAVVLSGVLLVMSRVTETTPYPVLLACHIVVSLCLAFMFTPVFTAALSDVPSELYSHASALVGSMQQVAGAAGAALLIAIMSTRQTQLIQAGAAEPLLGGVQLTFTVAAGLAVIAIVLAIQLRSGRPMSPEVAEAEAEAVAG